MRVSELPEGTRLFSVPATRSAEELGKRMVLNSVMVGFFGAVARLLDPESLRKAIADSVPAGFRELNLRAFDRGFDYGTAAVPLVAENAEQEHEHAAKYLDGA